MVLLGGGGTMCLGHTDTKLQGMPPSQEGPCSLAMEATNQPNEDGGKLSIL